MDDGGAELGAGVRDAVLSGGPARRTPRRDRRLVAPGGRGRARARRAAPRWRRLPRASSSAAARPARWRRWCPDSSSCSGRSSTPASWSSSPTTRAGCSGAAATPAYAGWPTISGSSTGPPGPRATSAPTPSAPRWCSATPVHIQGAEHFVESHTRWGCAAAPITDPWTGRDARRRRRQRSEPRPAPRRAGPGRDGGAGLLARAAGRPRRHGCGARRGSAGRAPPPCWRHGSAARPSPCDTARPHGGRPDLAADAARRGARCPAGGCAVGDDLESPGAVGCRRRRGPAGRLALRLGAEPDRVAAPSPPLGGRARPRPATTPADGRRVPRLRATRPSLAATPAHVRPAARRDPAPARAWCRR